MEIQRSALGPHWLLGCSRIKAAKMGAPAMAISKVGEQANEEKGMEAPLNSVGATTGNSVWKELGEHYRRIRGTHLRQLFENDPTRGERYTLQAVGLFLDYSKNLITDETLELLCRLAAETKLRDRIEAMFCGEKINFTENRAVLHTALRAPRDASVFVDGKNIMPSVHAVLDKMAHYSAQVRNGQWRGHTGKRIRNVMSIGIGGSDLGPVMVYEALKNYSNRSLNFRFVSNIDGTDILEALRDLDPDFFLEEFVQAGSDSVLVHWEGNCNLNRTVQQIKELGRRAGVAINPATPASVLEDVLPLVDLVLVMTVDPGFGRQHFLKTTLGKIERVRRMIDRANLLCELEVDGGVDESTAALAATSGADVFVAGSSVFGYHDGITAGINRLMAAICCDTAALRG